jgi:oligopeptide transport system permease protein
MTDVAAPAKNTRGRSLTGLAMLRLRRNKAAMASLVIFTIMVVTCVAGPWVMPHRYDQAFQSYVQTPPSLSPYPRESTLRDVMATALDRAHVSVQTFNAAGSTFTATLTSDRPIDPRVTRYVDRANEFGSTQVTATGADAHTITVAGRIKREYFLMGTDANGRDLFSRIMLGGQVSLLVGLLASLVSLFIGVIYGATSGFIGGRVDNVMMRLVEILYSLPFMFLVIMLVVFFGRNFVLIFVAIGAIEWLDMARIVRGQTLSLKRREFVHAAQAMGLSDGAVIRRHIIPNTIGQVVIFITIRVPRVILLESFLSFLGLGVQEPLTSWGVLIAEGTNFMEAAPWMLIFPALFFVVTLLSLNFIGDGLRDALDPRDR